MKCLFCSHRLVQGCQRRVQESRVWKKHEREAMETKTYFYSSHRKMDGHLASAEKQLTNAYNHGKVDHQLQAWGSGFPFFFFPFYGHSFVNVLIVCIIIGYHMPRRPSHTPAYILSNSKSVEPCRLLETETKALERGQINTKPI